MYCGEKTMDWKKANAEIALHNLNCEDGEYIYVMATKDHNCFIKIVPNRFFKDGGVVDAYLSYFESWKLIEPPTEDEILKQAKEICFKTGYVRNKDAKDRLFYAVIEFSRKNVLLGGEDCFISHKEIVEKWESVDPRA